MICVPSEPPSPREGVGGGRVFVPISLTTKYVSWTSGPESRRPPIARIAAPTEVSARRCARARTARRRLFLCIGRERGLGDMRENSARACSSRFAEARWTQTVRSKPCRTSPSAASGGGPIASSITRAASTLKACSWSLNCLSAQRFDHRSKCRAQTRVSGVGKVMRNDSFDSAVLRLRERAISELRAARGQTPLLRDAILSYLQEGYRLGLSPSELTDGFCVSTPNVIEAAGYKDDVGDEVAALFDVVHAELRLPGQ